MHPNKLFFEVLFIPKNTTLVRAKQHFALFVCICTYIAIKLIFTKSLQDQSLLRTKKE